MTGKISTLKAADSQGANPVNRTAVGKGKQIHVFTAAECFIALSRIKRLGIFELLTCLEAGMTFGHDDLGTLIEWAITF